MKSLIGSSLRLLELLVLVMIFAVLSAMVPKTASAAYFRLLNPLDEVKTGAFIKPGAADPGGNFGFTTTLVKHDFKDGFFLIPGISWSLLDLGAFQDADGPNFVAGPSVDLSEPVKLVLRRGLAALGRTPEGLAAIVAPASPGEKSVGLSLGPGWGLVPNWKDGTKSRGFFTFHAGISAKWKGAALAER